MGYRKKCSISFATKDQEELTAIISDINTMHNEGGLITILHSEINLEWLRCKYPEVKFELEVGEPTNVIEIIRKYLKDNGYDGLCNDDCSCRIENVPACDNDFSACEPGYLRDCTACEEDVQECFYSYCISKEK